MADTLELLIKLNEQVQGPATAATGALRTLEASIRSEKAALADLEGKLGNASNSVSDLTVELSHAKEQLAALKNGKAPFDPDEYKRASDAVSKLSNSLEKAKAKEEELKKAKANKESDIKELEKAVPKYKALSIEQEKAVADKKKLEESAKANKKAMAEEQAATEAAEESMAEMAGAASAAAAIIVALTAIVVAAAVAITSFALASADAARSARLLSNAAAGGVMAGAELEMVIDQIAAKTPLARARIAEMGRALEIAHLSGRRMQLALEAMAVAEAAIGSSAASKIEAIATASQKARRFLLTKADLEGTGVGFDEVAKALAESMGVSLARAQEMIRKGQVTVDQGLDALNKAVQKKFGKTVEGQMAALTTIIAKFKENLAGLFKNVDIEAFLKGLKEVADLFSQNTYTGVVMRKVITEVFNGIFAALSKLMPYFKAFVQGVVIGSLLIYLYFLKIKKAISDAFGGSSKSSIDWLQVALYAGIGAVGFLVGGLIALGIVLGVLTVAFVSAALLFALPFLIPIAIIGLFVYAIYRVIQAFGAVKAYLSSINLAQEGANIISGLIDGVLSMAGALLGVITGLAEQIKGALRSALDMHSPSRVMKKYGGYTVEGYTEGVEAKSGEAADAIGEIGNARPGGGKGKIKSGPVTINVKVIGKPSKQDIEELKEALYHIFDQELAGA